MSSDAVRFGVVGLGMGRSRSRMIVDTEGAQLVAVADLLEERRKAAEEQFGCETHADAIEMFERDDLDVAMIMTPSGLHAKLGIEAAKRGKHVITTKPMDVSLENCDALIGACDENGVKLLVDFGERYGDQNRKLRAALEMEAIGKPILCELRMKWFRADSYYEGWHGTWQMDGGGSVMNQGVHYIDLMQWFMGPVDSVLGAHYGIYAHEHCETEDLTAAVIKFKSGAIGQVLTTTTFPGDSVSMVQIHGEKGVLGRDPNVWEFKDAAPEIELPPYPKNVIADAIQVVRHGGTPAVDGHEGKKSVALNLAIYECARTGKAVSL